MHIAITFSISRALPSIVFNTSKPLLLHTRSGPAKFYDSITIIDVKESNIISIPTMKLNGPLGRLILFKYGCMFLIY